MRFKAILTIAIVLAIAVVYCFLFFGGFAGPSDACDYAGLAANLIKGHGFIINHIYPLSLVFTPSNPQPNSLWAPGFPIYLAAVFSVLGSHDYSVVIANLICLLAILITGFVLAKKHFDFKTGLVFVILMGVNQAIFVNIIEGMPEMLAGALLLLSIALMRDNYRGVMVSGIFAGLAILTRYQIVVLLPIYWVFFKKFDKKIVIFLSVVVLTCLPWLIRNLIVFGDPMFTLQRFGEFSKGAGFGNDYYYTYRSLEPTTLFDLLTKAPMVIVKKLVVGVIYFLSRIPEHFNAFGIILVVLGFIGMRHNDNTRPLVKFVLIGLAVYILFCSLDGHHRRHLLIFSPLLMLIAAYGFMELKRLFGIEKKTIFTGVLLLLFLIPTRFPEQEQAFKNFRPVVKGQIKNYRLIAASLPTNSLVASDASDALWWYGGLNSVWLPINYAALAKADSMVGIGAIYLKNRDWLNEFSENEKATFFSQYPKIVNYPDSSILFYK